MSKRLSKKKQVIEPDMAAACLVIMLEKLGVIKLEFHRNSGLDFRPHPPNAVRGMSSSTGGFFYTVK